MHWRRQWQPTPVFLPGESQGRGSLVGCHLWGRTESDTAEATEQQQQLPMQGAQVQSLVGELRSNLNALLYLYEMLGGFSSVTDMFTGVAFCFKGV